MLYESSYYGVCDLGDSLTHHGIKGQKWGVKNGPPYPLKSNKKQKYGNSGNSGNSNIEEMLEKRRKRSSVSRQVTRLAINTTIAIVTLNPEAAYYSAKQISGVIGSAIKTKRVNSILSKNTNVDPKTGLKLKQKEMTPKQDAAMVNPSFKNFNTNTKNNCMLCTTTYEMRRRGYDVTANKASAGYLLQDVKKWFPKAEVKHIYTKTRAESMFNSRKKITEAVINELSKQGDGARGNLMVTWSVGGGHSMVYEVDSGHVTVRCTQSNRTYRNPAKILSRCVDVSYARLDNVPFDKKRIKEACHS